MKTLGFARVALLGTGLIGGSIGLGLRSEGLEVTGYDRDPEVLGRARERGALSTAADGAAAAVGRADLVVLAVPVDRVGGALAEIAGDVRPGATVTDVGSAKVEVVGHGEAVFGERFVGGHPMAGSERHGIEAADRHLFEGASWIFTPTAMTSSEAYARVTQMAGILGSRPVAVDPLVHDALVARLSHLPQLTASALVQVAAASGNREALLGLAAGG